MILEYWKIHVSSPGIHLAGKFPLDIFVAYIKNLEKSHLFETILKEPLTILPVYVFVQIKSRFCIKQNVIDKIVILIHFIDITLQNSCQRLKILKSTTQNASEFYMGGIFPV